MRAVCDFVRVHSQWLCCVKLILLFWNSGFLRCSTAFQRGKIIFPFRKLFCSSEHFGHGHWPICDAIEYSHNNLYYLQFSPHWLLLMEYLIIPFLAGKFINYSVYLNEIHLILLRKPTSKRYYQLSSAWRCMSIWSVVIQFIGVIT